MVLCDRYIDRSNMQSRHLTLRIVRFLFTYIRLMMWTRMTVAHNHIYICIIYTWEAIVPKNCQKLAISIALHCLWWWKAFVMPANNYEVKWMTTYCCCSTLWHNNAPSFITNSIFSSECVVYISSFIHSNLLEKKKRCCGKEWKMFPIEIHCAWRTDEAGN